MSNCLEVAVVGGGLVGSLEACLLAKRGFKVTLFEYRHDGRNEPSYYGRSINLAISLRGIEALKRLDLEHVVKEHATPMKGRMIHTLNGKLKPIPYDPDGRCINSIERASLNNCLLNEAEQKFNVRILFNHKLVDMNAETGELFFKITETEDSLKEEEEEKKDKLEGEQQLAGSDCTCTLRRYRFDFILGCDGSRSSVRSLLTRQMQLEFSQKYIEHGYLELRIDAKQSSEAIITDQQYNNCAEVKVVDAFKMPPNYLHIWPRGQYMMIALPNKDSSFTCTLFMPLEILNKLRDPDEAINFFKTNLSDSIDLIGEERIKETLSTIRASSLISVKCKPYYFKNKVALLGDSAHAMVPFYGQGMNCGFEDCLVFDELLDKYLQSRLEITSLQFDKKTICEIIGKVMAEYSELRCPNGQAMCDLAMYNYIEMRDLVNTWPFILRKHLDNTLYRLFPKKWIPLYTMVTFSRIPVHECVRRRKAQDEILSKCFKFTSCFVLTASLISTLLVVMRMRRN